MKETYVRGKGRWAKVGKASDGKKWYCAKGFEGDVSAQYMYYASTKAHAMIMAKSWVDGYCG